MNFFYSFFKNHVIRNSKIWNIPPIVSHLNQSILELLAYVEVEFLPGILLRAYHLKKTLALPYLLPSKHFSASHKCHAFMRLLASVREASFCCCQWSKWDEQGDVPQVSACSIYPILLTETPKDYPLLEIKEKNEAEKIQIRNNIKIPLLEQSFEGCNTTIHKSLPQEEFSKRSGSQTFRVNFLQEATSCMADGQES